MNDTQKQALVRTLDALQVPYQLIDCDPELADTAIFVRHYDYALEDCANTILVKSKSGEPKFAACVVLAHCRLDVNHTIRKKLGARKVSFAGPAETQAITGMTLGGVTAVGLPDSLPLWVDSAVMDRKQIVLGGSSRDCKIIISPSVFNHTGNTEIITALAKPIPVASD
ncbi:MAG: hypothetical protein OXI60_01760 [Acidiferrobacterales bacterium]|nr:hypothetical protein [Acidiferrobacterales bacterium]